MEGAQSDGIATLKLYAPAASALVGPAVQAAVDERVRLHDISVKNATLEEVFIYLTGRHLR
jgi:hypothetical protein